MSKAAQEAMAARLKNEKINFVSGLTGGEISEINYVTAVAPVAVILWSVLQSRQSFFKPYTPLSFAIDFLLNVGAILLAVTLYSSTPILLNILLLAPVFLLYALPRTSSSSSTKKPKIPTKTTSQDTGATGGTGTRTKIGKDGRVLKPRRKSVQTLMRLQREKTKAKRVDTEEYAGGVGAKTRGPGPTKEYNDELKTEANEWEAEKIVNSKLKKGGKEFYIGYPESQDSWEEKSNPLPKKSFLTTYRGAMLVITCIAILAVDFRIFPRRFAKVENWGTSLMDVGVGSFVFTGGVVAARPILKDQLAGKTTPLGTRLYRSIRHSLPLIILGFIRLWSVKGLDYAEHVTEYGVHWNFFFTLGFMPPFLAIFQSLFQILPSYAALAILLGGTYQIVLETTDLKAYILTAPRTDLLSQNREGVFSFFGYLAIFLAGQATGLYIIPRTLSSSPNTTGTQQRKRLLLTLASWSAIWILLFTLSTNYTYGLSLAVSRRLANLPYFLWISAFNCSQLTAFCLIETLFFPQIYKNTDLSTKAEEEVYKFSTSRVLEAYNRNGLAIFLVANLLTGAVNLGVQTLSVGSAGAMGILLGYMGVLTGLAVGLDVWDVSIKM